MCRSPSSLMGMGFRVRTKAEASFTGKIRLMALFDACNSSNSAYNSTTWLLKFMGARCPSRTRSSVLRHARLISEQQSVQLSEIHPDKLAKVSASGRFAKFSRVHTWRKPHIEFCLGGKRCVVQRCKRLALCEE